MDSAATFSHEEERKIYYDDGNLDLVVGGVCFRVYRGVLAQHSPIFKDMFDLCVPSDNIASTSKEPFVNGNPATAIATVRLQDSARDWRHVLCILFHSHGRSMLLMCPDELSLYPSFDQLSACVRLGHKYQMSAIYAPAMDYLKRRFAPTLDGWKKWTTSRGEPYTLPRCTPAHAIGVVNLARLTGEHALLPLALLGCAQLGCKQLTDGFAYGDGQRETLSAEDAMLCLESVSRIAFYGAGHTLNLVQQNSSSACSWTRTCAGSRIRRRLSGRIRNRRCASRVLPLAGSLRPVQLSSPQMAPTESLTAESGHSEPTTANVRDEEFWFEDGSIILLVQNVEFRIYKGLLTEHSSAFVDLFSLPQPPTHSSCPVVRMSGDSARDWRHILRLYMPRRHTKSYPPMLSFEQVAAYVRLSHKYDMPVLYRASIAHLKRHFTDDLRVWVDHGLRPAPGFADIHAIGVVNLARLTHEPTLLPTALWMCCRLGPELLSGFAYSDGEVETLTPADVALCWAARPRLVQATLQTFLSIYPAPSAETCSAAGPGGDDSGCRRFATSFVHKMRHKPGIFVAPDPLIGYINMDGPSGKKLCEGCREGVVQWSQKVYFEAWKSLPELVGVEVPGWTESASPK
ncbi:uncharacterized protein BXZ73DRAFT_49905 [Epithele typhae]|uniref:uncharacterized protein n=1 Tax=Epithele typhae TaxID=378194 RepID=UPI0020075348|nr:uncharacterized protein BXZ73DRAFT_49905 [Epithele typhae]KAH9925689.1 hypothetical protein BXZ73DRAFT_49905 [Epithele typhae]